MRRAMPNLSLRVEMERGPRSLAARVRAQARNKITLCRLHTINSEGLGLINPCDPKGSEQFCNEFSTSKGGIHPGRPLFFAFESVPQKFYSLRICD